MNYHSGLAFFWITMDRKTFRGQAVESEWRQSMRAPIHRQVGISALFLLAVIALPAIARANSDDRKVINGANVRVKVVGSKTFIANKGPGPLTLKYPDGTTMATIPAGTALMIQGFTPGLSANGTLGARSGNNFSVSVSKKSQTVNIRRPDGVVTAADPNTTTSIESIPATAFRGDITWDLNYNNNELSSTDRDQISIVSGN